jgi:hypothetical protein
MLHTPSARRKLLRLLAPVLNLLVVDHMVGAQRLELLALGRRRSGRNDLRASRFGKLHGKHTHAARALGKDPVTGLQAPALQTVQAIPRRETGAHERAALQEIEVRRHADEALLVEGAVLLQGAVDGAANAGLDGVVVQGACEVALVEEGEDLVALLEARNAGADGFDYTGTVGGGDDRGAQGEGVEAFDDGQVAVVEGCGLDWAVLVAAMSLGDSEC